MDHAPAGGGAPLAVFESGAILLYLADKTGQFISRTPRARTDTIQWLFWQMGDLGPMAGQNNHFSNYVVDKIPYAMDRYHNEVNRLYGVLDKRLADRPFIRRRIFDRRHGELSVDVPHERQGQKIEDFPHLKRWLDAIAARPAVVRAYEKAKEVNPNAGRNPHGRRTRDPVRADRRVGEGGGALMRYAVAALVVLATAAGAAEVGPCNDLDRISNLVGQTKSYSGGKVRIAHVDTDGEPVCCSSHLLVFIPAPDLGSQCFAVSQTAAKGEGIGRGFSNVEFSRIKSSYDVKRGLLLDVPYTLYNDGKKGKPGSTKCA